jgi:hypothetical protein
MPTLDIHDRYRHKRCRTNGMSQKRHAQAILQFVFLVLHPGNTMEHSAKNTKLEKFLSRFDLFRSKGESMCYSAVLFYQKLSKVINLRDLETDLIQV